MRELALAALLLAAPGSRLPDPGQLALQFVTTRPFVTANIIGATTMEQLKTDIDSVNVRWSDELEKAIDAAHHAQPNPAP